MARKSKPYRDAALSVVRTVREDGSIDLGLACRPDSGCTQQQFKNDCDIHRIVASATRGVPPRFVNGPGVFADVSTLGDFRTNLEAVELARSKFQELPGKARAFFHQNPQEFLDYMSGSPDLSQLVSLGLADPKVVTPAAGGTDGGTTVPPVSKA